MGEGLAFIRGPVPEFFTREVTATPAQFERDLRQAWDGGVEFAPTGALRIRHGMLVLDITVRAGAMRKLGLFELPVLHADYRFTGGDEAARRDLLARLDRAMQRGGG